MADLTENSEGAGNQMIRKEELVLALENAQKIHEEQLSLLIGALRRNGVQVTIESNGSLVVVEDETPEVAISVPPAYNQYLPPSTYDPLPRTTSPQSFPTSQLIRTPLPSASQNGLDFTPLILQSQQYLPVYAPTSHNQFEICGYVLKPLYPPECDHELPKDEPSFQLLPTGLNEFGRQFATTSPVASSGSPRVPVDPYVAMLMEQVKQMQEKLDLMMSINTPLTQDVGPGKEMTPPSITQYQAATVPGSAPVPHKGKNVTASFSQIQQWNQLDNGNLSLENNKVPRKPRSFHFNNTEMPLSKILEELVNEKLIKPLENWKPRNPSIRMDETKHCRFHQYHGHNTDNCTALRHEIQKLIEDGKLENLHGPKTESYDKRSIQEVQGQKRQPDDFGMPMSKVFNDLVKRSLLTPLENHKPRNPSRVDRAKFCEYHKHYGHVTDKCVELKKEIQWLIYEGKLKLPGSPTREE